MLPHVFNVKLYLCKDTVVYWLFVDQGMGPEEWQNKVATGAWKSVTFVTLQQFWMLSRPASYVGSLDGIFYHQFNKFNKGGNCQKRQRMPSFNVARTPYCKHFRVFHASVNIANTKQNIFLSGRKTKPWIYVWCDRLMRSIFNKSLRLKNASLWRVQDCLTSVSLQATY